MVVEFWSVPLSSGEGVGGEVRISLEDETKNYLYSITHISNTDSLRINRYLPFAFLYFFFNILGLPFGLTWTALLGPFFYYWVLKTEKREILLSFVLILSPFLIVQLSAGVEFRDYVFSLLNLAMIFCFAMAVRTWFRKAESPGTVFNWLLVVNFILCLLALLVFFTPWQSVLWIRQNIT